MRRISEKNEKSEKIKQRDDKIKRIESTSRSYQVRQRAICIQLSYRNYTIKELSNLLEVTYSTIQRWLDRWDNQSFAGLYDQKGRGRKSTFNSQQESQIKAWVKPTPNLKRFS